MARGNNGQLSGGRELSKVAQDNPAAGELLTRIIAAVNNLAANAALSPVGKIDPPAPVDSISIQGNYDNSTNTMTVNGETLHFTLTHNQEVKKGVQYITEIDTSPEFLAPHVIDHGCSRSGFVNLPANDNDNNPQTYYMRSYAQYHGSDASHKTTFGGQSNATKIVMTGSSKATLLTSTGSGTATPDGQQGGKGLGTVFTRPAPGPKRNLK